MDIKKINFYFKEALYSSFFLIVIFSIFYPLLNYLHITEQKFTYYHIVWSYIASIFVATVMNYFLKSNYEETSIR